MRLGQVTGALHAILRSLDFLQGQWGATKTLEQGRNMTTKQRTDYCSTRLPCFSCFCPGFYSPFSTCSQRNPVKTQVRPCPSSAQNPPWLPPHVEKQRCTGSCKSCPHPLPALTTPLPLLQTHWPLPCCTPPQGLCTEWLFPLSGNLFLLMVPSVTS